MTTKAPMPMNQRIDQSTEPLKLDTQNANLPKITIITPSFNQAKYLEQTFHSVLNQKYPNLEWLVVDGASTDGSVDLIRKYQDHFSWWITEKDRNHPHALNKAYERATGEIIGFVNSDDLLEPGALHYVARQFKPGVNWIVGWAKYFDNADDEWVYGPQRMDRPIDFFLHNPIPQIASFWRTEAWKLAGPFTEKYPWAFDYEYWMRLRFVAQWKPLEVRRCLGAFRLHMESKTCSKPGNYGPELKDLHQEYARYLSPAEARQFSREYSHLHASRARRATWDALKEKDIVSARQHALISVRQQKWSPESWKALLCAYRGH